MQPILTHPFPWAVVFLLKAGAEGLVNERGTEVVKSVY